MEAVAKRTPPLTEGNAATALGQALLLAGERGRGLQLLGEGISSCRNLRSLDFWVRVDRPQLEKIGRRHGVELDDLGVLDPLVVERRRQLEELSDPLVELAEAAASTAGHAVVGSARALGKALLHLARGEDGQLRAALAEVSSTYAAEVGGLKAYLRDLAKWRSYMPL